MVPVGMSSAFVSLLLLPSAYRYRKTNMGNRYQVFVTHKIATWIGKKVTVPTVVARNPFTFFNLSTWVILIKLMQKYFKKIPSHLPIKACCFSQKCLRGTGTYHRLKRGSPTRFSTSIFFHNSNQPRPLINKFKYFRF